MATQPADFSNRLAAALQRASAARQAAPTAALTPPNPAATDEFSQRLGNLMRGPNQPSPAAAAAAPPDRPVGEGERVVRNGDCINSIAFEAGFFPDTLWNDPGNQELRTVRKNMDTLLPGDRVTIPELRRKDESCAAEQRHRFKRKGYPKTFRVQFKHLEQPIGNEPYVFEVDGLKSEGVTDASGYITQPISPAARLARVSLRGNVYELMLGHLNPIDTVSGVQERLRNLGLYAGPGDGNFDNETEVALGRFQQGESLPVTGVIDEATKARLVERVGE